MPKIKITEEDWNSILTMEAGWKKATVKGVMHKPSSKKDSMNYEITWSVENGPEDIRQLTTNINDKNPKMFMKGLRDHYEALFDSNGDRPDEIEPEQWIGLSCYVEVNKTIYNNHPINQIIGFSPNSKVPF